MFDRVTRPSLRVPQASSADRIAVCARVPRFSPGALETKLLARLDGIRSVQVISDQLGLAVSETLTLLERLERLGAVRFVDAVEAAVDLEEEDQRVTSHDHRFSRETRPAS